MPTVTKLSEADAVRETFYSYAQAEALIAVLPDHLKDFFLWGITCSWRKDEISSLGWDQIDRDARTVRLSHKESKNKKARTIALEGELLRIIERRWADRRIVLKSGALLMSPLVFHKGEGRGRWLGKAMPILDFDKAFKTACAKVGIPYGRATGFTFHCTRRSGIRNMVRKHVDPTIVMKISGHKTRSVFDRYNIVDVEDTADAMLKLDAAPVNACRVEHRQPESGQVAPELPTNYPETTRADRVILVGSFVSRDLSGAPGRSRTCGLWLRRPTLYPAELRARRTTTYSLVLG